MTTTNKKTATQLLLINWSRFQYETIRLSGSTLFTGANASGKSTVLDAMTYLLTGNKQFNTAAGDKERSVKSYVRGDTKANGEDRYLRSGDVISYIAMEFYSGIDDEYMVIGVGIESSNESDTPSPYWFIFKNTKMEDIDFGEKSSMGMSINPLSKLSVRGNKVKRSELYATEKAKDQIIRALGMRCDANVYRKKLMKMIAFTQERNIDQFISECVLEADPIKSLAQLREQKELFEKMRAMYSNLMDCKKSLEELETKATVFETKNQNLRIRELMYEMQKVKILEEDILQIQKQLDSLGLDYKNTFQKKEMVEKDYKAAQNRYNVAMNNADFRDMQQTIASLEGRLTELDGRIQTTKKMIQKLEDTSELLTTKLSWSITDEVDRKVLQALASYEIESDAKRDAFVRYIGGLAEKKDELGRQRYSIEVEARDIKTRMIELEQIINKLDANILNLPKDIIVAKEKIRVVLEGEGIQTEVKTFAELVDEVTDETYRNALETFLGRKRYHLIVDGKYCKRAMQIVEELGLYQASVVVTDKLKESEVQEGSAATLLKIPNQYARRYANYLLNGIHLCKDIDELHEYPLGGITASGMLAKSYAVSLMDMRRTQVCLGSNAIELQKKATEKEKSRLEAQFEDMSVKLKDIGDRLGSCELIDVKSENYDFAAPTELIRLTKEHDGYVADIEGYKNNPDFAKILAEQEKAKKQMQEADDAKNKIYVIIGGLESDIKTSESILKSKENELGYAREYYDDKKKEHADIILQAEAEYKKQSESRGSVRVITEKYLGSLRTDRETALRNMESAQLEYCRIAQMDNSRRGVSYIAFYRTELQELSVVKIEEAKNKMSEQEKNLQSAFMHDFVSEVNEAIRAAREEISAINRELNHLPFGEDVYHFMMEPKADRAIFFRISGKLSEYMNSPEMYMSIKSDDEEMENDIRQLMEQILDEEDESEYTDYRKYFTYDMKIIRNIGDVQITSQLSKKQGSASNGEKQTPYFIILAASLMQCYSKTPNCARLAFIDEAFAALSRERIEQMVKYFESNNFQVIYAAPPEKIGSIGSLINTTVSLYSKGKYSYAIEGMYES